MARLVRPPKIERTPLHTLSTVQLKTLLMAARGEPVDKAQAEEGTAEFDRLCSLYELAVTLGLRQAELLGLRWRDVDMTKGTLTVNGSLQRVPERPGAPPYGERLTVAYVVAAPKTRQSRRTLQLSAEQLDALRQHRTRQNEERLKAGKVWHSLDLVFPDEVGRPLEPGNLLRRSFWPLLERAKLPRVRFHDLRHSVATALLEKGTHPVTVAALLGHARASTTTDVYSHVTPALTGDAIGVLSASLLGVASPIGVKTGVNRGSDAS